MNAHEIYHRLELAPVIAAVKTQDELDKALLTEAEVIFVLHSNLMELKALSEKIKKAGKAGFLHVDLVKGLSTEETAIDYVQKFSVFDGIISTKPAIIRYASKRELLVIQRFFLLDSSALENVERQLLHTDADLIEVLPNVSPKVLRNIQKISRKPLIVGGLVSDKEDVVGALGAGCLAVSTTNSQIWSI